MDPEQQISPVIDCYSNVSHMTDFLDEKRKEIQARLKELKPLVDEYHRLEAAERALSGVAPTRARAPPPRPRRTRARRGGCPERPPRPPAGSRHPRAQALELVRDRPGITIPELAEAMGIKQNYLYRVMPDLAEEGQVVEVRPRLARARASGEAKGSPSSPVDRGPIAHRVALLLELVDRLVDPLLENSGTSSPCDDLPLPVRGATGNEEMIPSSTP